ncbi:MAG: 4'-phosphopantetheinyl transferase superfamily protein [Acidobacteria bacterium]|nr:4'-phosphopantetheinyl transferase superfamily protein [Acidobacteriota bacterium]
MSLGDGEADLWLLRPDQLGPEQVAMAAAVMNEEENARQMRLRYPHLRRAFTVTRALVRLTLSQYADVDPAKWKFDRADHGKPRVASPGGLDLSFSVTHTSSLIAVLVVRGAEVGVDVERIDREFRVESIAQRFFSPREQAELLALEEHRRARRFFQLWTAKEAYLKARGLGLLLPLDGFTISFDFAERPSISFHGIVDSPDEWQLEHIAVGEDHAATIAIRGGASRTRTLRMFDASGLWQMSAAATA